MIAFDHAAWRVISAETRPDDLVEDGRDLAVVVRPVDVVDDDPRARDHDVHCAASSTRTYWHVYPDEHYAVCAACREPMPCRDKMAETEAARAAEEFERYSDPSVCPACTQTVTPRQRSRTFDENVRIPGGPPVTFHVGRWQCLNSAARYEHAWAAADPSSRRLEQSCPGQVTNHADGTYECHLWSVTRPGNTDEPNPSCPGPSAFHAGYQVCSDAVCHRGGSFGCHPAPTATLRRSTTK